MGKRTPLYEQHLTSNAKIVDFGGWDMPLHYGSQLNEHHQVRQDAGVFDVSHMTVVDLTGDKAQDFLRYLVANDVAKLETSGKALYTCMLNENGGVIDDLIIYFQTTSQYRLVVNAATRDKDIPWITKQAEAFGVAVTERPELAMLAIQGPNALEKALPLLDAELAAQVKDLKPFNAAWKGDWFIGRTGYTGEDGIEVILPPESAPELWEGLLANGVEPIGLGARDTLRLEAGMCLYGTDMNDETTPLVTALGWTVAMQDERDFIGRKALEAQKAAGVPQVFKGLVLEGKGVLRGHQVVKVDGLPDGEITSGTFSPTLKNSIALARLPAGVGDTVQVEIRKKLIPAKVIKPMFVRNGKSLID